MMESPFQTCKSKTTVMYLEPILNSYYKTYQNVITFSNIPDGPINAMVTTISPPKLSEFQTMSSFANPGSSGTGCVYVLLRYPGMKGYSAFSKCNDAAMGADDIPSVFNYLLENGYTIDTKLTNMLQHSDVNIGGPVELRLSGNRRMICMFTFSG